MIGIPVNKNTYKPEDVWKENFNLIKDCMNEKYGKEIKEDIFEYYTDEVGIDKVVYFLKLQDVIEEISEGKFIDYGNYFKENKQLNYIKNHKEDEEENDDEENIYESKKRQSTEYDYNLIKSSLFGYFIHDLTEDIPIDSILQNKNDVVEYIKMFQVKFLYERLIPVLKLKMKDFKN